MRIPALLLAAASILPACRPAAAPPRPEPPRAVAPQPWGLKQCEAAPLDYPDPAPRLRPAPVSFASLPLDPDFAPLGVPLVTFRSAELVFHVSPTLPQAVVDCIVAAADDAVAFVTRALDLPRVFDGGPTRDVFLLSPDTSPAALESLDPGHGFDQESMASEPTIGPAFVGHPHGRRNAHAIFQYKRLPRSYVEIGAAYAHEWEHMVQDHVRGPRPQEIDAVVEGEAALMGALFQDAVVPGASSFFWDRDAKRLAGVRAAHPEMSAYELLTQPPHRHHDELTLFAYLSRGVDPPTLAQIRLLARNERADYESVFRRVVGRDLVDPTVSAVLDDPKLAPRTPLRVASPVLSIVRNEDRLWFVAPGFAPGEQVTRAVRMPEGRVDREPMKADGRGVVAWWWRLGRGARWAPRDVELLGASGTCSGRYFSRIP